MHSFVCCRARDRWSRLPGIGVGAGWQQEESGSAVVGKLFGAKRGKLRGRTNWNKLGSRLRALVTMKRQWGDLRDIYETRAESLYELNSLPPCTRDPDGTFASIWDLVSVALLLYVSATVPLRAGFEVEIEIWSFGFFFDLVVDIFFVVDLSMNFRTAYYDKNGIREDRPLRCDAVRRSALGWPKHAACGPADGQPPALDQTDPRNQTASRRSRWLVLNKQALGWWPPCVCVCCAAVCAAVWAAGWHGSTCTAGLQSIF